MTTIDSTKLLALALVASACSGGSGEVGTLKVTITGEDAATDGFPVNDEGEAIAFADGWEPVKFTKYLVSIGGLSLASADGAVAVEAKESWVVDLTKGDAELATFGALEARRWEKFSYSIQAAAKDAKAIGGVAQADVDAMHAGGFNYWIVGEATEKATGAKYTFDWKLKNPTRNADCTNGDDGKAGLVVVANSVAEAKITLHLEHAFWDRLGSEGAQLRFTPMAAVADANKAVTLDALATQALDDVKGMDGQPLVENGAPVVYDPGSTPLAERNLKGFVLASAASQGHLNGEGLCTISRLP